MRFSDDAGADIGLVEAALLGRPEGGGGPFLPTGEDDLRPAIYAPQSAYSDFAASAISALFPGDLDPMLALRLAERAFPAAPEAFALDGGLRVVDLTAGSSASSADAGAAFLGGILASAARKEGPRLAVADGSGPEGAALAEALAGIAGLKLALLYPEGSRIAGIRPALLEREGGSVRLISVRGGPSEVAALLASAAGKRLGGRAVSWAGPSNPARLAARIIDFAAIFSALRAGSPGELYIGLRAGAGLGLAACLWAWRLGIPLTGAILPGSEGISSPAGLDAVLGPEPDGRALAARFEDGRPGLIRSLVRVHSVDKDRARAARALLESAGGPPVDLGTAAAMEAASLTLDQGLRGHAKALVLSELHPAWSDDGTGLPRRLPGAMLDARPDADIGPDPGELEAALTR